MRSIAVQRGGKQILNSGLHVSETDNPGCGCCGEDGCQLETCLIGPYPDTLTVTLPAFVQGGGLTNLCDACTTIAGEYVLSRTLGPASGSYLWRHITPNFCSWRGTGCGFAGQDACTSDPVATMQLRVDVAVVCSSGTYGTFCDTTLVVSVEGDGVPGAGGTNPCCDSGGNYRWTYPLTYPAPASSLAATLTNPAVGKYNSLDAIPCLIGGVDEATVALGGTPAASVGAMKMPLTNPDCAPAMRRGKPLVQKGRRG